MLKQETHPKKKWKGMAESAQTTGSHHEERRMPSRISPTIDIESPISSLMNIRDKHPFRNPKESRGVDIPSPNEPIPINEKMKFHISTSSAFRQVGQRQKGMKLNLTLI